MKILFIARKYPPSVGGMERFAYDLSHSLEQQKIEIMKLTWGGSNKWLFVVLPYFFLRASFVLIADRKVDVIHIQDGVQAPLGWLLSKLFRRPYIVVAHGLDITFENKFYQSVVIPFVRRANFVASISTATNSEVMKRGVAKQKARVITLGTHDDYKTTVANRKKLAKMINVDIEDKILLLTTGRLVKRKGVEWFINNALTELVARNDGVVYLVAGEGAERSNIEAAILHAKLEENVFMLGAVSDEVKRLLYTSSDIFVMPNIKVAGDMEGFGIVAHEAATAGLPVVASDMEGIKDAVKNGKNGTLVKSENKKEFIDAIDGLIKNPNQRKSLGKAARKFTLDHFGWKKIALEYLEVYKEVTKK